MKLCLQCGEENSARARFCQACGEPLGETFVREDRRTVTVLYSDVVGSTRLSGRLGPEAFRRFMEAYIRAVREVIGRHGGTIEKFIGDAVMAIFGVPELHEDDAIRGVRAASELHAALEPLATELRLRWNTTLAPRTAVNPGEVAAGGGGPGEPLVTGDVVTIGARLEGAAGPEDVLLAPETSRLVRDLVRVEPLEPLCLRGIDEPVAACRFVELSIGAGPQRKFDSPLIGRDHEIGLLQEAFDRVVAKHRCELFTVLGAVGVGKSRLVSEFAHAVESEALVLTCRCPSYGEAKTFWPLAQIVRQALDISDGDPPAAARTKVELSLNGRSGGSEAALQLAELIGLADMDGPARERFWAVGKWFQRLAEDRPVVVVLDDIHWAEATFLQLIKDIAVLAAEVPLLVVCVARTELLEQHHGWLEEEESAASVMLAPLADDECARLVRYVLGGEGASEEVQAEIVKSAQGNPLFLQEMLAMLLDEGLLVDRDGRYVLTITPAMMRVPPTIHALLPSSETCSMQVRSPKFSGISLGPKFLVRCARKSSSVPSSRAFWTMPRSVFATHSFARLPTRVSRKNAGPSSTSSLPTISRPRPAGGRGPIKSSSAITTNAPTTIASAWDSTMSAPPASPPRRPCNSARQAVRRTPPRTCR